MQQPATNMVPPAAPARGLRLVSVARARPASWPRATRGERIGQACAALLLAALIGLGMWLPPSPTGVGTHEALGLPPCGMLETTGHPCPTCGATTSFALAAHGRFYASFVNQPFGLAAFLSVLAGFGLTAYTCVCGRSWINLVTPFSLMIYVFVMVIIALGSWAYKWSVM
jgi:hypothetical protein